MDWFKAVYIDMWTNAAHWNGDQKFPEIQG